MSKVSVYANEEARLIEFIADDWRFSLWLDEPMSYSFVCKPTQKNIMVGEELPEKVINVLRSLLTQLAPDSETGAAKPESLSKPAVSGG